MWLYHRNCWCGDHCDTNTVLTPLEIADTVITVLNTSTIVMEEAKSTFDLCAELNVTEVQTKVAARFAVLLDRSLLGKHTIINYTFWCRHVQTNITEYNIDNNNNYP